MDTARVYIQIGFEHILPLGFDHILFVLSLFLLSTNLKTLIWQATAFTIAHSITLALATFDLIKIPSSIVEPSIALSILVVALENIFTDRIRASRIIIIFIFGLVHGLGFAGALTWLGVPKDQFLIALLSFNIGVELAQITVIFIAWYLIAVWFQKKPWYRKRIVIPASALIAGTALFWMVQRIFQ